MGAFTVRACAFRSRLSVTGQGAGSDRPRRRSKGPLHALALGGAGALVALLGGCTSGAPTPNPTASTAGGSIATAVAVQVNPTQATVSVAANISPAPALTSTRREAPLVAAPRHDLEVAAAMVANNNMPAARAAMEVYDGHWNGIEVYVNFRSRELYGELETHWQGDINDALADPSKSPVEVLPMLRAMIARYDEAIRLSDTGAPLSPLFDDLATLRTVRAPLRTVTPALNAGDTAKASAAYAAFKASYPLATTVISAQAADTLPKINDAIAEADKAMRNPTPDSAASVDALVTAYNAAVNKVNTAARDAGYTTS